MRLLLISLVAILTGCQAFAPKEERSDYAAYAAAVMEARKTPAKAFDLECPATGCILTKLTVYAGNGGHEQALQPPAPAPKPEHPFVGGLREIKEFALGLAPFAAPIFLVDKAMGRMGQALKPFAERPPTSTVINDTYNTISGNGNAMNGSTASTSNRTSVVTRTSTDSHNIDTVASHNTNCQTGPTTGTTTPNGGQVSCPGTSP